MNYAFTLDTATYSANSIGVFLFVCLFTIETSGKSERENRYVFMKSLNQCLEEMAIGSDILL